MKIVVCDDEIGIVKELEKTLKKLINKNDELITYTNYNELQKDLLNDLVIDILFMDIKLNKDNGINLVKENNDKLKDTKIVYITGYDEYIEDTFETEPIYILRKPLDEEKIKKALNKAIKQINDNNKFFSVKTSNGMKKIKISNILYIESKGRIIDIHTYDEIIKSYCKISDIEKILDKKMLRIHKSYLINIDKIKNYMTNQVILENDESIPISRTYNKSCKNVIMKYLGDIYE